MLLDDGAIELRVLRVTSGGVECRVMNSGVLGNKKVLSPPTSSSLLSLTQMDMM